MRVVALLRAVNVGGRILRMADLKEVLTALHLDDPRTLLQSGNAVFGVRGSAANTALAALETRIEKALEVKTGIQSDTFVRTVAEWDAVIAGNPFEEASSAPARTVVMTLRDAPGPSAMAALTAAIKGRERVHLDGRALYAVYPDGIGTSKLTNVVIERALGTRGTARNWNTVLKLQALLTQ